MESATVDSDRRSRLQAPHLVALASLLAVIAIVLLIRNLALESPLMAGDEYAYFAAAQTFPHSAERFASDLHLPRIYSPVFAAYGRLLFVLSRHAQLLLKVLNTAAFLMTGLLFLGLVRRLDRGRLSILTVAVFLLLPSSAYTAYFMPETTYTFLFALLTWSIVARAPDRLLSAAILAGAIVGTMLLVKPHALAVFLAGLTTLILLLAAPARLRPPRRSVALAAVLFVGATYATLVCVNGLLSGAFELQPFFFVGGLYQPYLAHGASLASWTGRIRELVAILAGHLIVLVVFLAPALTVAIVHLRRLCAREPAEAGLVSADRRRFVLICFAAVTTVFTLGMTVNFEAQAAVITPAEHFRLHGRYYSYVIPLFLTLYFGLSRDETFGRRGVWLRAAAAIGCVAAALLLYLGLKRTIYPFDYPEAFVFSSWRGTNTGLTAHALAAITYAAILASVATYAALIWRGRSMLICYPLLLLMLFAISSVEVTGWQRTNSLLNAGLRADAMAMRQIIPPEEHNLGLVVGPEWNGPLAYFMFNLGSGAHVLVRDNGLAVDAADLPANARWVLLIGPYAPAFAATEVVRTPRVTLIRVGGSAAVALR